MSSLAAPTEIRSLPIDAIRPNRLSLELYGDPDAEIRADGLLDSVRERGILVPLVASPEGDGFELLSGHRRLSCARALGLESVPCEVRDLPRGAARRRAVLDYNRQRRKTFSQLMREADALEALLSPAARERRAANLRGSESGDDRADRRDSDGRRGRTDEAIARALGLGGKDLYRQARAVWKAARAGDPRAKSGVSQLDQGTKSVHAAYKDLRRRDRLTTGFRPTPYDVWAFRRDPSYGVPHPGSIPAGIVAHALHYFTGPGTLVVDPMAGGGTTVDVCEAMGRRCLAYDLDPVRPEIRQSDVRHGFPPEARGCDLIFCDPPYHTMLSGPYAAFGVEPEPLTGWVGFLRKLCRDAFETLRPGGHVALLLANQTEKDLPAGFGYVDHAFFGYAALAEAGFLPVRRISCPMDGSYLPQHVQRARAEGRLLGQVRDLLVMRKP
ncbi:DNA methyltransferase [Tautonia plasticadhaerens]|uniref:Putative chromosome-partitioning protein ParB n=1 Tax=Tautonia plasticadhaerens TaxID=2527974 RepID=A0A518H2H5_9BACT|nr:DNA methyltransferase [Tautonia plasticadhaerens]QDV35048.1 putative chromosome-partitioning protein ParB [Tautonia plasticadhaerens]